MLSVPSLLDCWHVRDLPRFRRVCTCGADAGKGNPSERSAQKTRSPASLGSSAPGLAPGPCAPAEVNRRDALGRTVLHHLAAADEAVAAEYFNVLLTHPSLNVNLQDLESGYTALHRALYVGNLRTALTLLQRADTDTQVRDHEGLTAFDLYNLTVPGTSPAADDAAAGGELFVWGANRNYTLGLGHCDDSALPERVKLRRATPPAPDAAPGARFDRLRVRDVAMSRWHTVVLTTEPRANVHVCGIGSLGRLARMPPTQPTLEPLRDLPERAVAVAAGPEHTVLVTASGAVYTFGANRMAALGYTVEEGLGTVASSSGTVRAAGTPHPGASRGAQGTELDVQVTPRRVLGVLKREAVRGAAASRLHTVVYTADAVYTWGTNTGQLGYDHHAAPVQVQPRRIAAISQPVQQVAATEFATACLLTSGDVVVFHADTHFRIAFPTPRPLADLAVFRPRHAPAKPTITRLTCSGTTFAALAADGSLFTFALEHPTGLRTASGPRVVPPRPQLVWSVRRKFAAVRDAAIGPEGALILCTASGHVYVRGGRADGGPSRAAAARAAKFHAVPFLQRVVRVMTNDTGSFAALGAPSRLADIPVRGASLEADLRALLPPLGAPDAPDADADAPDARSDADDDADDDADAQVPTRATAHAQALLRAAADGPARLAAGGALRAACAATGCDAELVVERGAARVPAHRTLLAVRVPAVAAALRGARAADGVSVADEDGRLAVALPDVSLLTALFLLHYVYTDEVPPVWTANLGALVAPACRRLGVPVAAVRAELLAAARTLGLEALARAVDAPVARAPEPQLRAALAALYARVAAADAAADAPARDMPAADVVLHLADRDVACHALFLRRSPMLHALLEWRRTRGDTGVAHVDLRHQRWAVVRIGLAFLYTDAGAAVFAGTDDGVRADEFVDLVLDVLQLADELLLHKLQAVCQALLRARIKATNVAALLSDARRLNAPALADVCMEYATRNLETLLEAGFLHALPPADLAALEAYVQRRQDAFLARTVASDRLLALTLKHQAFVDDLDLPKPSLHLACLKVPPRRAKSPALRPVERRSPEPAPPPRGASADDSLLFAMDDVAEPPPAWQTVGRTRARRSPRTEPAAAERAVPAWSLDARRAGAAPSPAPSAAPARAPAPPPAATPPTRPARALGPADVLHAASPSAAPPPVSVETQEALARLPLTARVSQKERKKQRPAPEPTPSAAAPAWGRTPRTAPASSPAPARAALSPSPAPARAEVWRASPGAASPQLAASSPGAHASPPALSFAQIQQQQHAEGLLEQVALQTPTSFAQILHEERVASERARREQQEAEAFERWFEEESRRVQQEQQRLERSERGRGDRGRRGRRGGRAGRGRGRTPNPATARIDDA